jgi:L-ascorbate metabolism protein UlaG (beta-lactamase superfamily)
MTVSFDVTFIGTATLLLELRRGDDVLRLLTDPVFDAPGTAHRVAGLDAFTYTRLDGPAVTPTTLPPIDAVLLSHDHHADNLDTEGRKVASRAARVLTTKAGAGRLRRRGTQNAEGYTPWQSTVVERGSVSITVTATPARHGPFGTTMFTGPVIGFLLEWPGQRSGGVWISGDTVWYRALRALTGRVGVAFVHLGAARLKTLPFLRYSMDAGEAVKAVSVLRPRVTVPIHFEGWSHFREGRASAERTFEAAGVATRWLEPGAPTPIEV